jgi:hypothetical protein
MMSASEFDRVAKKALSEKNYLAVKTALEKAVTGKEQFELHSVGAQGIVQGSNNKPNRSMSGMLGKTGTAPTPKENNTHKMNEDLSDLSISGCGEKKMQTKNYRQTSSASMPKSSDKMPPEVEELPAVFKELKAASNWKDREQILNKLDDVIQRRPEEVISFGKLTNWLDAMITASSDSNTKISVYATKIFDKSFLKIKHGLTETHMINLTKLLADKLSSTTPIERDANETFWITITNNYDTQLVMKPLISYANYSNIRVKSTVITKVNDIIAKPNTRNNDFIRNFMTNCN